MKRIRRFAPITLRYLEYVNNALLMLSMLVLATLALIIVYQVLMRYVFHGESKWVFELAEYGMIFIIFLPLAYAEQLGQHIRVDAITMRLSTKMNTRLNLVALALSLFYVGIFTWSSIRFAHLKFETGENSSQWGLGIDKWIIIAVMAIGLIVLWLNLLVSLIRNIAKLFSQAAR